MADKTRKDEIFEEAMEKYGVKLDRQSPLEVLEDKLDRLSKKAKTPSQRRKTL